MAFNLVPLYDHVIVKRVEEKETTKGGIIIPDTAKQKPLEGEVLAVGAGKLEKGAHVPLDLKVGDRVLLKQWTGTEYNLDGDEILIIREDEVLAKFAGAAKAAGGKK
jgi:chaperonin GroES